jgi:hypothetical protein
MTKNTIVYFRHGALGRPVVEVVERENPDDVTIRIRSKATEHLSLHRTASSLRTNATAVTSPPSRSG